MVRLLSPILIVSTLLFFIPVPRAYAAITFDNAAAGAGACSGTTKTVSYTTGSGLSNSMMILTVDNTGNPDISSATYAGVSMTLATTSSGGFDSIKTRVFILLAPTAGTNNIVITGTTSCFPNYTVETIAGVQQSTTPDVGGWSQGSVSEASHSETVKTVSANDFCVSSGFNEGTPIPTTQSPFTGRASNGTGASGATGDTNGSEGAAGTSVTGTWNVSPNQLFDTVTVECFAPANTFNPWYFWPF